MFGILPYLQKLHYAHADNADLKAILSLCYQHCKRVALDIDILTELGEKIGIECYFATTAEAISFLYILYERGMCGKDKFEAVKAYLEAIHFDMSKQFQTFFSHVKLAFNPGEGITAKAYIGYAETGMA